MKQFWQYWQWYWHNVDAILTQYLLSVDRHDICKKIQLPQFLTPKTHHFANLQQKCSKVLKQCWQCWQCWPMTMLIMLAMLTMLTMPTLLTMIMLSCGTVEAIWKQYLAMVDQISKTSLTDWLIDWLMFWWRTVLVWNVNPKFLQNESSLTYWLTDWLSNGDSRDASAPKNIWSALL